MTRELIEEPIDPDLDPDPARPQWEPVRDQVTLLGVIALGGSVGALARYGLAQLWPTPVGGFPWATFTTNVLGCFLIGVLMVLITDVWMAHRLLRPFLGVGILGGFTTFSTYASEIRNLLQPNTIGLAFGYLAGTLICALLATMLAVRLTRATYETLHRRSHHAHRGTA
ncbi:fluoride efflux transporter FluC [Nocardia sp. NPDC051570]|uniref:fluoride efflux transporter FluC n=1 Tax=Nocardia sp. NPDC051570 TaxID=3364324 RepID=UPI003795E5E1